MVKSRGWKMKKNLYSKISNFFKWIFTLFCGFSWFRIIETITLWMKNDKAKVPVNAGNVDFQTETLKIQEKNFKNKFIMIINKWKSGDYYVQHVNFNQFWDGASYCALIGFSTWSRDLGQKVPKNYWIEFKSLLGSIIIIVPEKESFSFKAELLTVRWLVAV